MNLTHPKNYYVQPKKPPSMLEVNTYNFWEIALQYRGRSKGRISTSEGLRTLNFVIENATTDARVRASAYVLQQAIILGVR